MRIIDTFICLLDINYVKVHRGRDEHNNNKYFIEYAIDDIVLITEEEFLLIKDK